MKTLPVSLLPEGRLCVVIGAGPVGARKAAALLEAGATVRVVGKRFSSRFDELGEVERIKSGYNKRFLEGAFIVIAATSSASINRRAARDARAAGALVNVVDTPSLCDFHFPSVARKGDVAIAVSTGGASPALARRLREKIEASVDDVYASLAGILKAVRRRAIEEIPDAAARRAFFEQLAGDPFLKIISEKGPKAALAEARRRLDAAIRTAREVVRR